MGVSAYLSLIGRRRGGRLLTFSAFRMGAYSSWALIRGWALIRINTVNAPGWQFTSLLNATTRHFL